MFSKPYYIQERTPITCAMTSTRKIMLEKPKNIMRTVWKHTSKNAESKEKKEELRRSSRLLGIYRNGAKSKCIRKDESKDVLDKARLDADALKLVGDTPEEYYGQQTVMNNDTTTDSSNKECTKENLNLTVSSLEQSPTLGKKRRSNAKLLIRKRYMQNLRFEKNKKRRLMKSKSDKSKCAVAAEDIHKRISCQKRQNKSKSIDIKAAAQIQLTGVEENMNTKQTCSNNNNGTFMNRLQQVFCTMGLVLKDQIFDNSEFVNNLSSPTITVRQKLKHLYSECSQLSQPNEMNNRALLASESTASSVEACTNNTSSQSSSINFEVGKCNDDAIATVLQTYTQKDYEFHSNQNNKGIKRKWKDKYLACSNFESHLDQNFICKHDNNQSAKQSVDVSRHTQSVNCDNMNEKRLSCIILQENSNCGDFPAKDNKGNMNKFHISKDENFLDRDDTEDYWDNKICSNVPLKKRIKYMKTLNEDFCSRKILAKKFKFLNHVSMANISQEPEKTTKMSAQPVQNINDSHHMEPLFNESEIDEISNTNISQECYEKEQPNSHTLSSISENDLFERTVYTEPDRNQVPNFEINMRLPDINNQNPSQSHNFESFSANEYDNTNEYDIDKNGAMDLRKTVHVNDHRSVDYLRESNLSTFPVKMEPMEQRPRQSSSRTCENNNANYNFMRRNVQRYFHGIDDATILSPPYRYRNTREEFSCNIRRRHQSRDPRCPEMFSRADAVHARSQSNYFHCNDYEYASHEQAGTSSGQNGTIYTRNCNNSNTVQRDYNSNRAGLFVSTQNTPLPLRREHYTTVHPTVTDQHQRPASVMWLQPLPYMYMFVDQIEMERQTPLRSSASQTQANIKCDSGADCTALLTQRRFRSVRQ